MPNTFARENFIFWKNLMLIAVFVSLTPIVIGLSLFSLVLMKNTPVQARHQNLVQANIYADYPTTGSSISTLVGTADARVEIVKQYLEFYNSPLTPYSSYIVGKADQYQLDFRLITAIAQQESNLCKVIPAGSYNCWGWGITSQASLGFNSFEEGIDSVSKGLRNEYIGKGYITIDEIESKYNPNSNGSWANGVSKFAHEME